MTSVWSANSVLVRDILPEFAVKGSTGTVCEWSAVLWLITVLSVWDRSCVNCYPATHYCIVSLGQIVCELLSSDSLLYCQSGTDSVWIAIQRLITVLSVWDRSCVNCYPATHYCIVSLGQIVCELLSSDSLLYCQSGTDSVWSAIQWLITVTHYCTTNCFENYHHLLLMQHLVSW